MTHLSSRRRFLFDDPRNFSTRTRTSSVFSYRLFDFEFFKFDAFFISLFRILYFVAAFRCGKRVNWHFSNRWRRGSESISFSFRIFWKLKPFVGKRASASWFPDLVTFVRPREKQVRDDQYSSEKYILQSKTFQGGRQQSVSKDVCALTQRNEVATKDAFHVYSFCIAIIFT